MDTGTVMRIDIHSHLMNVAFLEHLQGRGALPTAVRDADGFITHCTPHFSVRYRPPILSVEAKLADMDAAGIDLAVLSPGPPSPAVLSGALADSWAARINDELAVIAAAHPGRFAGWASLGFGDPSRAIAEVDRCLDQLGLAGFRSGPTSPAGPWTPPMCCPYWNTSLAGARRSTCTRSGRPGRRR
jgi:predicted TIM-barrel fold metal-dependent hydrolase